MSASRGYLHPIMGQRPNLAVRTNAWAKRVIFDRCKKARGVEYLDGDLVRYRTVHVRREVILAAGAIDTPKLLMLSGIGPAGHLRDVGIAVRIRSLDPASADNAALKALDRAGLQPGDIDLWEINEAFASVTLNSMRMLDLDEDRVNVNGGAVAIGHPIGASGARILGTLVHELRRRGGGYGCAAICSGGGQGDAVIVKV